MSFRAKLSKSLDDIVHVFNLNMKEIERTQLNGTKTTERTVGGSGKGVVPAPVIDRATVADIEAPTEQDKYIAPKEFRDFSDASYAPKSTVFSDGSTSDLPSIETPIPVTSALQWFRDIFSWLKEREHNDMPGAQGGNTDERYHLLLDERDYLVEDVPEALEHLQQQIDAIPDPMHYAGSWNASTNTPALVNPDATKKGYVYRVTTAGTRFGFAFNVGDRLVYNDTGTVERWDTTDEVWRVNGKTGDVSLVASDVGAYSKSEADSLLAGRAPINATLTDAAASSTLPTAGTATALVTLLQQIRNNLKQVFADILARYTKVETDTLLSDKAPYAYVDTLVGSKVNRSGDSMTGRLTNPVGYVNSRLDFSNTELGSYLRIAVLTVTGGYANSPISFKATTRQIHSFSVWVYFANVGGSDPGLAYFKTDRTEPVDLIIRKDSTSTWSIWMQSYQAYERVTISELVNHNPVTVSFPIAYTPVAPEGTTATVIPVYLSGRFEDPLPVRIVGDVEGYSAVGGSGSAWTNGVINVANASRAIGGNTAGWRKIGRWIPTRTDGGEQLAFEISAHNGYDYSTSIAKLYTQKIIFSRSNDSALAGGFRGNGMNYIIGDYQNCAVKVTSSSAGNTNPIYYEVYVYFPAFSGGSYVHSLFTTPGCTWTWDIATASDPGSNSSTVRELVVKRASLLNLSIL